MKTVQCSIPESRVKEIIREEIARKLKLSEEIDHEGAATAVKGASKLLKAIATFREDATGAMSSAVTPHLDLLSQVLEAMVSNPSSYVDKVRPEPKRIRLRNVGNEK